MNVGSSAIVTCLVPSDTRPMIHAARPLRCWNSRQYSSATLADSEIKSPPDVSTARPISNRFCSNLTAIPRICLMIGSVWIWKSSESVWKSTKFLAWPCNPKPVTSVAACALYLCISSAAILLRKDMDWTAISKASWISFSLKISLNFVQFVDFSCSQTNELVANWVPNGLVSNKTSPDFAPDGLKCTSRDSCDCLINWICFAYIWI